MTYRKNSIAVPALEHLAKSDDESFVYRFFEYDYFPTPWHYHPEFELVLVVASTGMRYIGNHVKEFAENDLCFIGTNVPHTYKSDEKYHQKKKNLKAKSIVIHFSLESFGGSLLLPELKPVYNFLKDNRKAYEINGDDQEKITEIMKRMQHYSSLKKWYSLLQILEIISKSESLTNILTDDIEASNPLESMRLIKVFEYVKANFHKQIKIETLANLVHMTETSFSRFFIQRTRVSFTEYLIEFRLSKAIKLLLETEENIDSIANRCGFFNMSNFNRHFKKKHGITPNSYRKTKIIL